MKKIETIIEALEFNLLQPGSKEKHDLNWAALVAALEIRQTNRNEVTHLINGVLNNFRDNIIEKLNKNIAEIKDWDGKK